MWAADQLKMNLIELHRNCEATLQIRPTPLPGSCADCHPHNTRKRECAVASNPNSGTVAVLSCQDFAPQLPRPTNDSEKRGLKTDARLFVWNHVFEIGFVANRTGERACQIGSLSIENSKTTAHIWCDESVFEYSTVLQRKVLIISRTGFSGIDKNCESFSALRIAIAAQDV